MTDGEATLLVGLAMVVGLAGTVVPILPGLAVLWTAGLVYGLLVGFGPAGIGVMVAFTVIVSISVAKSILLPRRMAAESNVVDLVAAHRRRRRCHRVLRGPGSRCGTGSTTWLVSR